MDWTNESYVRLYTRDTLNWRRMGWDGQNVLMQLLRKVDRSGVLELGDCEPWEALVVLCGAPEDAARRGMDSLVRLGTVTIRDRYITLPGFLEAQECAKSDKLRARESRQRRSVGNFNKGSQEEPVTKRDDMQSQNATPESRKPSERHDSPDSITPRHSSLSSALLPKADPEEHTHTRARELPRPEPANDQTEPTELDDGEPEPSDLDRMELWQFVSLRYRQRFSLETGTPPGTSYRNEADYRAIATWIEAKGGDPERLMRTLLDGFFADHWVISERYPLGDLAKRPERYFVPAKPLRPADSKRSNGKPTRARATTAEDFRDVAPIEEQLEAMQRAGRE